MANIPKPIRVKPVQMEVNNSMRSADSGGVKGNKRGGVLEEQKAQPKVWGALQTRKEQKGKMYNKELPFDDVTQF